MPPEIAVIGAGPAGLAAAIQLKRYGFTPLIFEGAAVGGLLRNANLVENYPGFPTGISGSDLVKLMKEQARRIGLEITFQEVQELSYQNDYFLLTTSTRTNAFDIVLIASGTRPRTDHGVDIPEYLQSNIFYEVHPLLHLANKCIAIVGSGDAAFDYALNLSKRNQVIILNRSKHTRCLPLLSDRAARNNWIEYREETKILMVKEGQPSGLEIECEGSAGKASYRIDQLIFAIGREPQTSYLSSSLLPLTRDLEERGRLYFIGDVKNDRYRQTSIAVGDGVLAAMKIYQTLQENNT